MRIVYGFLVAGLMASASPSLYAQAQKTTVLIHAFENQTGDRTLDWIGEGIATTVGDRLGAQPRIYVFGLDERAAEYERFGIPETVFATVLPSQLAHLRWAGENPRGPSRMFCHPRRR